RHDQVEVVLMDRLDRLARGRGRDRVVSRLFEDQTIGRKHRRFVVHNEHLFGFARTGRRMRVFTALSPHVHQIFTTGMSILKTVPLPTLLRTAIRPPWFATMPLTIQSPNPVPFSPLVVTNGSKIVRTMSFGMPVPVSAIRMRMNPCTRSGPEMCRVRTRS